MSSNASALLVERNQLHKMITKWYLSLFLLQLTIYT